MALQAFGPLPGVIANTSAVTVALHSLTVQNGHRGTAALADDFPDDGARRVIEGSPLVIERPLPEDVVNSFPRGKVGGQIAPRAATLDDIEDGIQDAPMVGGRASTCDRFEEHRFEVSPLGIGETDFRYGVFLASTETMLKIGRQTPSWMSLVLLCSFTRCQTDHSNLNTHPKIRLFRGALTCNGPNANCLPQQRRSVLPKRIFSQNFR
jgi:hypothetical protein